MALKKTIITGFGITVNDAYHRIEGVQLISKDKITFQVRASIDGQKPHFQDVLFVCNYVLTGENPIKQAYEYLKTLPEFAGAIDC
jgi:5-methylcytosine-specific restriction endonuclease McrBC regulatory subunit McrC